MEYPNEWGGQKYCGEKGEPKPTANAKMLSLLSAKASNPVEAVQALDHSTRALCLTLANVRMHRLYVAVLVDAIQKTMQVWPVPHSDALQNMMPVVQQLLQTAFPDMNVTTVTIECAQLPVADALRTEGLCAGTSLFKLREALTGHTAFSNLSAEEQQQTVEDSLFCIVRRLLNTEATEQLGDIWSWYAHVHPMHTGGCFRRGTTPLHVPAPPVAPGNIHWELPRRPPTHL
jgi:hypothetical protein